MTSQTNAAECFPESELIAVLRGERVIADTGQVNGVWKKALNHEIKAGRLTKWRGYWHPIAGASFGIGPLKTCYGTAAVRDALTSLPAA